MTTIVQAHTFSPDDLVGGHVVIDLVNTVTARNGEPVDWLDGYPRLLEWAALTDRFDAAALTELGRLARAEPDQAALALDRVRDLREALHAVLTAPLLPGAAASAEAVDRWGEHWKRAVASARLTLHGNPPRLAVSARPAGLDHLTHVLALEAFDLLRSLPWERTRVCSGARCGWVFLDRSRGGRRRWCSMATCGNSAKGRTHYQRRRRAASPPGQREHPDGQ